MESAKSTILYSTWVNQRRMYSALRKLLKIIIKEFTNSKTIEGRNGIIILTLSPKEDKERKYIEQVKKW